MNTQTFVQEVNNLTTWINSNSVSILANKHCDEDGYMDHEGMEIEVDQIEVSISYLLAEATNPTLPCLARLVEAATRQGYFVDYQAAA